MTNFEVACDPASPVRALDEDLPPEHGERDAPLSGIAKHEDLNTFLRDPTRNSAGAVTGSGGRQRAPDLEILAEPLVCSNHSREFPVGRTNS